MKNRLAAVLIAVCCTVALVIGAQTGSAAPPPKPPKGFFGIAPQTELTQRDVEYMKAGGIESIRWPLLWHLVQPTAKGGYNWAVFDPVVGLAARQGISVLPVVFGTPRWLAGKETKMPIDSARARRAWKAFLRAAVDRYGPRGELWAEKAPGVVQYEPAIPRPKPIRTWQVWNEANFFYFAFPVSPTRYARLLKLSTPAIKRADRGARVVLSGLFGEPTAGRKRGMAAEDFLAALYRVRGIKSRFDGVALHPYAVDAETLEELVEGMHEVMLDNRDRVPFYVTEMGWGSQNNFKIVAFEQGHRGQVRQLRDSYRYLMENQRRLNLKQVYWYSWKDLPDSCSFCDSVGFFKSGPKFRAKPSWRAFVGITGGRARP
ncbi:MAG TPA: hypothetical protein VK889_08570 [Solirubrobacterales bacterium]|nr:hypothetical protein [Solirubrobacterales bacterium]